MPLLHGKQRSLQAHNTPSHGSQGAVSELQSGSLRPGVLGVGDGLRPETEAEEVGGCFPTLWVVSPQCALFHQQQVDVSELLLALLLLSLQTHSTFSKSHSHTSTIAEGASVTSKVPAW